MSRFNLITGGGPRPTGPLGKPTLNMTGVARSAGQHGPDLRSKKGYTGSKAGLGRAASPTPVTGPIYRSGPKGPAGARFVSVRLPNRGVAARQAAAKRPAGPSLMKRISRRAASILGL